MREASREYSVSEQSDLPEVHSRNQNEHVKGCPICFSLSMTILEDLMVRKRQAEAYRTCSGGMFIVEHGGKLRPEEKYQTRHVAQVSTATTAPTEP